jgi:hypothetical protein
LRDVLTEGELRNIYFDSELLSAVIATSLSPNQFSEVTHDRSYAEDNRTVLFAPSRTEELVGILNNLAILANLKQSKSARLNACYNLYKSIEEDDRGRTILKEHCAVVAQR